MRKSPEVVAMLHYYEKGSEGRDFYSSGKKDDYVGYVDKGIRQTEQKPEDYLGYADNHEKSSGVFNAKGPISDPEKKELRKRLRETDSCIWDMVISFDEDYGKANCGTPEKAMELLSKILPPFFKSIGLNPEKTTWYAGLHQNTDNRHIHLSFFQDEPNFYDRKTKGKKYRRGKIPISKINDLKMSIERHYLSPIQGVERMRQLLVEEARKAVSGSYSKDRNSLGRIFQKLYEEIPKTGDLGYSSKNMDSVRSNVDAASDLILENSGIREPYRKLLLEAEKRDEEIRAICSVHHADPELYLYAPKFRKDMKRRMGNAIIKEIVKKRSDTNEACRKLNHPKAIQRTKQKTLMSLLNDVAYFTGKISRIAYEEYASQKAIEEAWDKARFEIALEKGEAEIQL